MVLLLTLVAQLVQQGASPGPPGDVVVRALPAGEPWCSAAHGCGTRYTLSELRQVLRVAGAEGPQLDEAVAVAHCETGLGTDAYVHNVRGVTGDVYGVFQLMHAARWSWWTRLGVGFDWVDGREGSALVNARMALQVRELDGDWATSWPACAALVGVG